MALSQHHHPHSIYAAEFVCSCHLFADDDLDFDDDLPTLETERPDFGDRRPVLRSV